jgi:hypothetical protein
MLHVERFNSLCEQLIMFIFLSKAYCYPLIQPIFCILFQVNLKQECR